MWDRRISGRSMAGHLGIDESTMARKLRGNRKWTLDEVLTVARVLDVPVAVLLPEMGTAARAVASGGGAVAGAGFEVRDLVPPRITGGYYAALGDAA